VSTRGPIRRRRVFRNDKGFVRPSSRLSSSRLVCVVCHSCKRQARISRPGEASPEGRDPGGDFLAGRCQFFRELLIGRRRWGAERSAWLTNGNHVRCRVHGTRLAGRHLVVGIAAFECVDFGMTRVSSSDARAMVRFKPSFSHAETSRRTAWPTRQMRSPQTFSGSDRRKRRTSAM